MFPRIDSPCPLKKIEMPASGNFNCSTCNREVQDLTHLSESERRDFLAQCEGSVCVSYRLPINLKGFKKAALAGVFVIASNGLAIAAAAETPEVIPTAPADGINSTSQVEEDFLVMGGIDNPKSRAIEKTAQNNITGQSNLELIPIIEEEDSSTGT